MYSYEDRIRAVKLYIKLGKRIGPTIRKLGYPKARDPWHCNCSEKLDFRPLRRGGRRTAAVYSLVETAKLNGVDRRQQS